MSMGCGEWRMQSILGTIAGVGSVAFSPDGSALAVGGTKGVTLWDVHEILQLSTSGDRHSGLDGVWVIGGFDVTGRHKITLKVTRVM